MTHRIKTAFLLAVFAVLLPAALSAQQQTPAAAPNQQQLQEWMTELQQLNVKLESIQIKAMEDPALQSTQQALGAQVQAAMEQADPTLPASLERMQALEAEAMQAQQSGDREKLQQLAQEAQQIQARFVETQARVFQQPELSAKLEQFQTQLEQKMISLDPEAAGLIKRFRELESKLTTAMQGS